MAAADWARGVRLEPGARLRVTSRLPDATAGRPRPRTSTRSARRCPRPSSAPRGATVPTWKVPRGDKGKGFVLYRKPHKTAVDPETGEMYDDLLVIQHRQRPPRSRRWSRTRTRRSSPSTTSATTTPCWCSSPGSARSTVDELRRGHHRRVGDAGTEEAGQGVPRMPVGAAPMTDAARLAAYDVLRAVRVDDAYANLVLPQAAARAPARAAATPAFATELAGGTLRRQGTYDAVIDACLDRRQGRAPGPRRAAARRPPAAGDAGARPRRGQRTVDLVRARGGPRRPGSSTPCCARIAAARPRRLDRAGRSRRRERPGRPRSRRAQPPAVGGRGARRGAGRPVGELRRPARRRQRSRRG